MDYIFNRVVSIQQWNQFLQFTFRISKFARKIILSSYSHSFFINPIYWISGFNNRLHDFPLPQKYRLWISQRHIHNLYLSHHSNNAPRDMNSLNRRNSKRHNKPPFLTRTITVKNYGQICFLVITHVTHKCHTVESKNIFTLSQKTKSTIINVLFPILTSFDNPI